MTDKYIKLENGIYYAELDGTKGHYELGRQNGIIFSELIKDNVHTMRRLYGDAVGIDNFDRILTTMYESQYLDDLRTHAPTLFDELRGIADGSGILLKEAFMLNYLDELPNALIEYSSSDVEIQKGKCTAASVINRKQHDNIIFQNMDFTDAYDGYQVVFKIKYQDKSMLVYGFVGQFGGIGINSKGLGVAVNVVINTASNTGKGIPSTAITRLILERNDVEDCQQLMADIPISSGGSYLVTDPDTSICFEASANTISAILPKDNKYIIHTNHAIVSDDLIDVPNAFDGRTPIFDEKHQSDILTIERYALAETLVSNNYLTLDKDEAIKILSTEPILLHCQMELGLELNTLQSMINICSREKPLMYVAKGRNKRRLYVKLSV